ncbi:ATP-grasp domain-containing protein [Candidatus Pelagibacter sp.]|jgi:carbamoyl-phosphate synthase large subunit|nr:ATP-grasp domain-containing protein [Candidatus Pelagibacter sp.]
MKQKILISSANGIVMKSLITELKKNFYVIGIDIDNNGDAKNYCDEFYLSPPGNSKTFLTFINKLSTKVKFIFLFVDEEILNVNLNRNKLKKLKDKIILSNYKTIDICLNKKKFFLYFKNSNIKIPTDKYSPLMVAKPIYGRGGANIYKIKNKNEFLFYKKKKDYLVQKFIDGTEYTVDCLFDHKGKLIFNLPRKRLLHKGVSIIGKIVQDKKISKFVDDIAKHLTFYGPINVQLIKDNNNKIWLIEINPRLSGSIEFSIKAGFNPLLYFKSKKDKFKIKYGLILKRYFQISI